MTDSQVVLVDDDWTPEDPYDGIPPQVLEEVGCYDHDTAGGCG
jgi:hypothetical protein